MAKEKKAAGADKKRNSNANKSYTAGNRRYVNKLKKVKRHIRKTGDTRAAAWLKDAQSVLSIDYKRGHEKVRELHEKHFG